MLAPLGVAPFLLGEAGIAYGAVSIVAGALILALAWRVFSEGDGPGAASAARKLFGYSILYLFVLFAVLLIENRLGVWFGQLAA